MTKGGSGLCLDTLMKAAMAGDGAAYHQVLGEVTTRLRRMIRTRAPYLQAADIEDIVQDTLLSLHASRATWDPARPFMPWLASIARNRMADHARRYGRRTALDLAMADFVETFDGMATNDHAQNVVNFLSARDALEELTPAEREAVRLLRLRQLTLAEASAESGASVAALKVAVHRAARRLRAAMARTK